MKKSIKVEKNIPIPAPKRAGKRGSKYPFHKMEIGDSFMLPLNKKHAAQSSAHVHSKNGKKFTTRVLEEGVRVWRVE